MLHIVDRTGFNTICHGILHALARYFSGCASRSISMRLWSEFAKGSNFRNLALFGSGYAGLGWLVRASDGCPAADRDFALRTAFWLSQAPAVSIFSDFRVVVRMQ